MKSYICNIKIHKDVKIIKQSECVKWLSHYHDACFYDDFQKFSVSEDYISTRKSYVPGICEYDNKDSYLYQMGEEESPLMSNRAVLAQEICEKIFNDFYEYEQVVPEYLNHISCTHYQSPSAAQKVILNKKWEDKSIITHLYHMGCYAAFPALRVSKAYISDGASKVDNVHTELCSFHLDRAQTSADQIIMKTLFADGAIKYSVLSESLFQQQDTYGLEIIALHEKVIPNSDKEMSWLLGERGFIMGLTKNVPIYIAKKIESFMQELFSKAGFDYASEKEKTIFAVHPGGPKIIELVEKMLKLQQWQVKHSKNVLYNNGNMSSATIGHIWNEILQDENLKNTNVVSVAFGPGLTVTGAFLKICKS